MQAHRTGPHRLCRGLICVRPAYADATRIDIRTNLEGDRFSSRRGAVKQPLLVVKWVSTDFANYIVKENATVLPTPFGTMQRARVLRHWQIPTP
jgi:hypothetical protein